MKELKQIDITSCGKIVAGITLVFATIGAIILLLITLFTAPSGFFGSLISAIIGIVIMSIVAGILAAIQAWIYNLVAAKIGGVKITLSE